MNRGKKNEAYTILLDFYRQRYPTADKEEMKKKINSMRTNFRKELKKKLPIEGDVHETTSWYFNELLFLIDQQQELSEPRVKFEKDPELADLVKDSSPPTVQNDGVSKFRERKSNEGLVQDEFEQLAGIWANELRKMEPLQQLYAKKAINDAIFEGRLGTLGRNSVVVNTRMSPCSER